MKTPVLVFRISLPVRRPWGDQQQRQCSTQVVVLRKQEPHRIHICSPGLISENFCDQLIKQGRSSAFPTRGQAALQDPASPGDQTSEIKHRRQQHPKQPNVRFSVLPGWDGGDGRGGEQVDGSERPGGGGESCRDKHPNQRKVNFAIHRTVLNS